MNKKSIKYRVIAWCCVLLCGAAFIGSSLVLAVISSMPIVVFSSSNIDFAPGAKVLPKNEKKQIGVIGVPETQEVLELPEWGIRLSAIELRCAASGAAARYAGERKARRITVGEFEIEGPVPPYYRGDTLYVDTDAMAAKFLKPLPREAVQKLPPDIVNPVWSERENALVLNAECEGEPVQVQFSYCPSGGKEILYLQGIQKGNKLINSESLSPYNHQRYYEIDNPELLFLLIFGCLPLLIIFVLPSCTGLILWVRELRTPCRCLSLVKSTLFTCAWGYAAALGVVLFYMKLDSSVETSIPLYLPILALLCSGGIAYLHTLAARRASQSSKPALAKENGSNGFFYLVFILSCGGLLIVSALFVRCGIAYWGALRSEPIVEVAADRLLPENEGKLVRVCGIAHALELQQIPEWGIGPLPATQLQVYKVKSPADAELIAASAGSPVTLGAYTLQGDMFKLMGTRVLTREDIGKLPEDLNQAEWELTWLDKRKYCSQSVRGLQQGYLVHYGFLCVKGNQMLFLVGRQKGNTLEVLRTYDSEDEWACATCETHLRSGSKYTYTDDLIKTLLMLSICCLLQIMVCVPILRRNKS